MGIGPWASRGRKRTWQARFCVAIAGFRMGVPPIRGPRRGRPGVLAPCLKPAGSRCCTLTEVEQPLASAVLARASPLHPSRPTGTGSPDRSVIERSRADFAPAPRPNCGPNYHATECCLPGTCGCQIRSERLKPRRWITVRPRLRVTYPSASPGLRVLGTTAGIRLLRVLRSCRLPSHVSAQYLEPPPTPRNSSILSYQGTKPDG
jgi:hypothetical protein